MGLSFPIQNSWHIHYLVITTKPNCNRFQSWNPGPQTLMAKLPLTPVMAVPLMCSITLLKLQTQLFYIYTLPITQWFWLGLLCKLWLLNCSYIIFLSCDAHSTLNIRGSAKKMETPLCRGNVCCCSSSNWKME